MGSVKLPFAEPMYSAYHWLSNAGVPAKQNPTSDNWYYNYTVGWTCTRKFLGGYTTPEMGLSAGYFWDMKFMEINAISNRFVRQCSASVIRTMLDDGYYVAFEGIDDYFIQGKSWYHKRHFTHDGLIIGYDDEKQTFTMAAYDQRWIFTTFDTPQRCVEEALAYACAQGESGWIHALKASDEEQTLDVLGIREQIKAYLEIGQYPLEIPCKVEGRAVYDFVCMYLDKLIDGSIPYERGDKRVFRLIWEHKKCMQRRIAAIESERGWSNKLSCAYHDIVKLSEHAKFVYSKFFIKFSSSGVESIQRDLMEMKEKEGVILNEVLDQLEEQNE